MRVYKGIAETKPIDQSRDEARRNYNLEVSKHGLKSDQAKAARFSISRAYWSDSSVARHDKRR